MINYIAASQQQYDQLQSSNNMINYIAASQHNMINFIAASQHNMINYIAASQHNMINYIAASQQQYDQLQSSNNIINYIL